jgi:hypothetical protein
LGRYNQHDTYQWNRAQLITQSETRGRGCSGKEFIIRIYVGASVGIVVVVLIVSAKRRDHADNDNPELRVAEYAVMNNETDSRQNSPGFSSHGSRAKNGHEKPVPSAEAFINRP